MKIGTKTFLGLTGIGLTVTLAVIVPTHRMHTLSEELGSARGPALQLCQGMQTAFEEAVKESFGYVVSGNREEKAEFHEELRRFDALASEFAATRRSDDPERERTEEQLQGLVMTIRSRLAPAAEAMFVEYERAGRVSPAVFSAYHASVRQVGQGLREVVARETAGFETASAKLRTASRTLHLSHYLAAIAAVAAASGLGWLFFQRVSRPIFQLRDAAAAIAAGNMDLPIDLRKKDEVGELAAAFEQMRSHLRATLESLHAEIAERNRPAEELGKSGETLRAILNASSATIFLMSVEGTVLSANEALGRRLGRDSRDLIGANIYDFLPPRVAEARKGHVAEAIRTARPVRFVDERDCQVIDQTVFPVPGSDGSVDRLAVFAMDITDRKRNEHELRMANERLEYLLTASPAVIYCARASGSFGATFVSRNITTQTGYSADDFIDDEYFWLDRIHPDDRPRIEEEMERLFEKRHHGYEYRFLHKDGTWHWMYDEMNLVRDADGHPPEVVGYWVDITQRKQMEDAVQGLNDLLKQHATELVRQKAEAEEARLLAEAANGAKTDFLANISHELRTPLNAVMGFSELLLDRYYGELNEKQSAYVRHILDSGLRLQQLVENMLAMAQVDSGSAGLEPSRFTVRALLNTVLPLVNGVAAQHNIQLILDPGVAEEIEIEADRAKLEQIVFNLLSNAVKFTPAGGSVRLSARKVSDVGALLAAPCPVSRAQQATPLRQTGDFIEIAVEDTGIGIRPEDLERLFQPFGQLESPYTKKYAGAGLGLALTKRLVELHGGRVRVESEPGKGSRFIVLLPSGHRSELHCN